MYTLFIMQYIFKGCFYFRPFLRAMLAVHVGQYHFPFGGASIPTQG